MRILLSPIITLKKRNKNNVLPIDENESDQINEVSPRNT